MSLENLTVDKSNAISAAVCRVWSTSPAWNTCRKDRSAAVRVQVANGPFRLGCDQFDERPPPWILKPVATVHSQNLEVSQRASLFAHRGRH